MNEVKYGISKNLGKVAFDESVERVTEALKSEGFGVLTEIDVKATLKKKLDVDFKSYKILGACNPPLAHGALQAEPLIGLLLPCNVVVMEEDDATITVSVVNPTEMFKVVDNDAVASTAEAVGKKLNNVMGAL